MCTCSTGVVVSGPQDVPTETAEPSDMASTASRRAPTQFPFGHLTADAGASADPVLVEIVQGSLASVELEVETAAWSGTIATASRSAATRA